MENVDSGNSDSNSTNGESVPYHSEQVILIEAEAPSPLDDYNTTGSTTVVDVIHDTRSTQSLADILDRQSGVSVREYGGPGYFSTISIRGSNPNQVDMYLDGIPISGAAGGEVNLEDYNLQNMKRLEIYRSGEKNSTPVGGSLNLVTMPFGDSKEKAEVNLKMGSYHTFGMGTDFSGQDNISDLPVQYNITMHGEVSDQDFTFRNNNGTVVLNEWDDYDDTRKNAWYKNYFSTVNLKTKINRTEYFFLYDMASRKHGVPGPVPVQTEKTERNMMRYTAGLGSDSRGIIVDWFRLKSRIYISENKSQFFDPLREFSSQSIQTDSFLKREGAILNPEFYLLDWHQTLRMHFTWDQQKFERNERNEIGPNTQDKIIQKREHDTFSVEDEFTFDDMRLTITPSFVYHYYNSRTISALLKNDFYAAQTRLTNMENEIKANIKEYLFDPNIESETIVPEIIPPNSIKEDHRNYRIGGKFVILDSKRRKKEAVSKFQWFVRASYSTGSRIPDFMEIFGERGSIVGNANLRPEQSENYETGTGVKWNNSKFAAELDIGVFRKYVQDMILFIPNSRFTLRPENVDAAKIRGAEITGSIRLFKVFHIYGNYTFQQALNDGDKESIHGNYLPLRPVHEWQSGFSIFWKYAEWGVDASYTGPFFRDPNNDLPSYVESQWIFDMYLNLKEYEKSDDASLEMGIEFRNILDARVTDITGYPLPGRNIILTLKYRF